MRLIAGSLQQAAPCENRYTVLPALATALVAVIAAGCGGGGGDSNAAPVLGTASFSTSEDTDVSGQLSATDADGDTVTFAKATDPTHGTITSFATSGAFVYRPNGNYSGADSFSVRLTDARGGSVTSNVSISIAALNDAPVAVNDVVRVDGAGLASINVKSNDSDPEGDAVTITIEEPAAVGTATVNADGTVRLAALPAGFKGVTRFKYKAADASGASNVATAAIFVGTDPFRVAFAGDESTNGQTELFMTDFVATFRVSAATDGNLRLKGFAAAENGSTLAYTRQDSATGALDLSFVRTTPSISETRVTLPAGFSLVQSANQFVVSRDGQWIAFLATSGTKISPFVLNVGSPGTVRTVEASSAAVYASQLKFSNDSAYLYFLGSNANGNQKGLYRTLLSGNAAATPVSVGGSPGNDVTEYQVAQDQSRVAIAATRSGAVGIYTIDPTTPAAETLLSTGLGLLEAIESTTLSKPLGLGSPNNGSSAAFTTRQVFNVRSYVVNLSGAAAPQLVQPFAALGLSPNGDTLLYSRGAASAPFQTQVWETVLVGGAEGAVGDGTDAVYDSDQSTVILTSQVGGNNVLSAAYRGGFGSTTQIGTAGQAARFFDLSGAPRAVALIGEGPTSGTVNDVHLALINARAPGTPLFLGTFNSPLNFGSSLATVVTY